MSNNSSAQQQDSTVEIQDGMVVSFHYRLCEVDSDANHGEWIEQSYGKQPLTYLHGYHNVIVGLEQALGGRKIGDQVNITLKPEEAYGARLANSIQRIPVKHLHLAKGQKRLTPGMIVTVKTERGYKQVIVAKVGKFNVDVDFNHPLAGKVLYYEVEVMELRDGTPEELDHGHVHGVGGHHH